MTHARRPAKVKKYVVADMCPQTCRGKTLFVFNIRSQACKGKKICRCGHAPADTCRGKRFSSPTYVHRSARVKKIRRRGRMPMGLYRLKSVSTVFFQRADFCADKAAVNLFFGLNFNAVRASISRPVLCSALSCCRKANNAEKVSCFCSLGMSSFSAKKNIFLRAAVLVCGSTEISARADSAVVSFLHFNPGSWRHRRLQPRHTRKGGLTKWTKNFNRCLRRGRLAAAR